MSRFEGVRISDQSLQNQFSQAQLRSLESKGYINLQTQAAKKLGNSKSSSTFLKATGTTLHTVHDSEKEVYVAHIDSYLRDDKFMRQFLPIDASTDALFDLVKDGVIFMVNQKMMLMLIASIIYFYLQQCDEEPESTPSSVAVTLDASPALSVNDDEEGP